MPETIGGEKIINKDLGGKHIVHALTDQCIQTMQSGNPRFLRKHLLLES